MYVLMYICKRTYVFTKTLDITLCSRGCLLILMFILVFSCHGTLCIEIHNANLVNKVLVCHETGNTNINTDSLSKKRVGTIGMTIRAKSR